MLGAGRVRPVEDGDNAGETGITADNVDQLEVAWTGSTGSANAREAIIDRGMAYVRSDEELTAFGLGTGATRWSTPVGGSTNLSLGFTGVPAIVDGWIYAPVSGPRCGVAQISPDNGLTWGTSSINGLDPALVSGGTLQGFCKTADALLAGRRLLVPTSHGGLISAGGSYNGQAVCPAGGDFRTTSVGLHAVNVGESSWATTSSSTSCGAPLPPVVDYSAMSLSADQVLVGQGTTISAYAVAGCDFGQACPASWSVDVGGQISSMPIALDNGDVAVLRADGQLVVVDGATHAVEWTAVVSARGGHLAADGSTIFAVATDQPAVFRVLAAFPADGCGAATCTPDWTSSLTSASGPRPSIAGNVLYVPSGNNLRAYSTAGCGNATCPPLWTGATTSSITGAPSIHAGTVVVGGRDGAVTGFSLPD